MTTDILTKRSGISGSVPSSGSLEIGELALNTTDGGLFYHDTGSDSVELIRAGTASFATIVPPIHDTVLRFYDGASVDTIDVDFLSNGTTVSASIETQGGGDIRFFFTGTLHTMDTTPAVLVELTAGSDISPQENFIYVTGSGGTLSLVAVTTDWPTGPFAPIATVFVQSPTSASVDGVFKGHAWTDHLFAETENGQLSHINKRQRHEPAHWDSGVAAAFSSSAGVDEAWFNTEAGIVFQLHDHPMPALNMAAGSASYLVNDPTTVYKRITELSGITQDASGDSLVNNRYYNFVIWGVISEEGSDCHFFINLPTALYNKESEAQPDIAATAVYSIPTVFRGTSFLIARATLQYKSSGVPWVESLITDLRGLAPSTSPGGGAAISDHGALSGLLDDDHPQYLLTSGSRPLAAAWNAGQSITSSFQGALDGTASFADETALVKGEGSGAFTGTFIGDFTGSDSFTGSFTGALDGTASFASTASMLLGGVETTSFAETASFATSVGSGSIIGALSKPQVPSEIAYEDEANIFTETQIFSGSLKPKLNTTLGEKLFPWGKTYIGQDPFVTIRGGGHLFIRGANANEANGPHTQWYTDADTFPLLHFNLWSHGNITLNFDCYYNGGWRSSYNTSQFQIYKSVNRLQFNFAKSNNPGAGVTFKTAFQITTEGGLLVGTGSGASLGNPSLDVAGAFPQIAITDDIVNNKRKRGAVSVRHYSNVAGGLVAVLGICDEFTNEVKIGGGSSQHNAATSIEFYTGEDSTTPTGDKQLECDNTGSWDFQGNKVQTGPLTVTGSTTLTGSLEPADPADGESVTWYGSNGNLNIKANITGTIKSGILFDFDAA